MITLEVCSNSVQSSIEAQRGGAIRVELCDNLIDGGTTPALSQIESSRSSIHIQLYVIIRPRGGDFLYSEIEFETMTRDIYHCGEANCDGVVIGILDKYGNVDKKRNTELIHIARSYGMGVTFHRAFDRCADMNRAMEDIIDLGCERILTSGGCKTALEGRDVIRNLIERADGRIGIMAGSGITENNISELVRSTGLREFHGSFRSKYNSGMVYKATSMENEEREYSILQTDSYKVEQALKNANAIGKGNE